MTTRPDLLDGQNSPDRLYYATGVFLDATDLQAEQTYHRSRMARVLDYLHGYGTVAGLSVGWETVTLDDGTVTDRIRVQPGLAVDRLGRMIEIPRSVCLDLSQWWRWQEDLAAGRRELVFGELGSPDDLASAHRTSPPWRLTVLSGATTDADIELTLDGDLFTIEVQQGNTPAEVASRIASVVAGNWNVVPNGPHVSFENSSAGSGTYAFSPGTSGVAAEGPTREAEIEVPYVLVDVFVRFAVCDRGKTPAFADGPFDGTDAVKPSRLRDGYEVSLVIRPEEPAPAPARPFSALSAGESFVDWLPSLHQALLDGWRHGSDAWDSGPPPANEHRTGWDPSAVLLARLAIPAAAPIGDAAPVRTLDLGNAPLPAVVDNLLRPFAYPNSALVQWLRHAQARRNP